MEKLILLSYLIALIAVIVFVILIFRKKADIDYMQEYDKTLSKVVNSSTRIMFFALHGWVIFYMTYQMLHDKSIDLMVVITILSIAWGGKAGIDAIKKEKPNGTN
jgi:hypothetical protein